MRMSSEEVRSEAERLLSSARGIRNGVDDVHPILVVKGKDEDVLCDMSNMDWSTTKKRENLLFRLGSTLGYGLDADRIFAVVDAWAAFHDKGVDMDTIVRPSEDPNRVECLMVISLSEEGQFFSLIQRYNSGGDEIEWGEVETSDAPATDHNIFTAFFNGKQYAANGIAKIVEENYRGNWDFVFEDTGRTIREAARLGSRYAATQIPGAEYMIERKDETDD